MDYVKLVLQAALEGELDDHPLMRKLRLRFWWEGRVALAAAGLITASCSHRPAEVQLPERAWVTISEEAAGKPLVVPEKPLPGQSVAPCEDFETEIHGGCWVEVPKGKRADGTCSPKLSRHEGSCYLPVRKPPVTPRSATP